MSEKRSSLVNALYAAARAGEIQDLSFQRYMDDPHSATEVRVVWFPKGVPDVWKERAYAHARGRKKAKRRAKRAKQDFARLLAADTLLLNQQRAEIARLRARLAGDNTKPGFYARYAWSMGGWYICGPDDDGAVAFFGGQDG